MDPKRRAEIVKLIREQSALLPWPEVAKDLAERGFTPQEIARGLDAAFPGDPRERSRRTLQACLLGASVGVLVWCALALAYHWAH